MNLKELLNQFEAQKDKDIVDCLIKLYPDQKRFGYFKVLKTLRNKRASKTDLKLVLRYCKKERYTNVSGVDKKGQNFAIEFTPWSQWLAMEIDRKTLKNYRKINIVAHCLWEMTYSGFEESEIRNKIRMLDRRVKAIDKKIVKTKKLGKLGKYKLEAHPKFLEELENITEGRICLRCGYEEGTEYFPCEAWGDSWKRHLYGKKK